MAFDINVAQSNLRNLGYADDSDEMKALLGFGQMVASGGDQPKPLSPTQAIVATLGAGAQAGLARLGGANHTQAVTEAAGPLNRLMKVNDDAFSRNQQITQALAELAVKDRFSQIGQARTDARNKAAADQFDSIYGTKPSAAPVVKPAPSITPASKGLIPSQASPAAPAAAPGVAPAPEIAPDTQQTAVPGIVTNATPADASPGMPAPAAQGDSGPAPSPSPAVGAGAPAQAASGSPADQMLATLKTPQAKRAFQLSIATIRQQIATGNLKDGATLDNAYKAATDIDRQTLAQDPAYQASLTEAKTEGEQRGKQKADQEKATKTAAGVGEIMDTLEALGHDPDVSGAIGPIESNSWIQAGKGAFGAKSYNVGQQINSAKSQLQLIMTRLLMSGQGNISEGERSIVNDAIGKLESSATPEAYLDNVRFLRELMSGVFNQSIPSQFNAPSSQKDRVQRALDDARKITEQDASNQADAKPDVAETPAAPYVPKENDTATNPKTGEKLVRKGDKWVPLPFTPMGAVPNGGSKFTPLGG